MLFAKRFFIFFLFYCSISFANTQTYELIIAGTGADIATMAQLGKSFSRLHSEITVRVLPSIGSSGGIRAAANGRIQIGLSSRNLRKNELKLPVSIHHYARTPLVLATSTFNPADKISSEDYFAVQEGLNRYWPSGQLMRIVLRPSSDSDTLVMQRVYPEKAELIGRSSRLRGRPIALTDQDAAEALTRIPGAVGTSTLAVIEGENRKLKALTLDGIEPTVENMHNGHYPLWKNLYIVVSRKPSEAVKKFIDFMATAEAREILERTGHEVIPMTTNSYASIF